MDPMRRTTLLCVLILGIIGLGTALSQSGGQKGKEIPADVMTVIKKHCVRCHTGAQPPKGLRLIPAKIASAIDAPSAEVPSLKIIDTEAPEASYLLKKVRNEAGIAGKSMPPGNPLKAEDIQILATWIAGLK
jgi:hypothetical protein